MKSKDAVSPRELKPCSETLERVRRGHFHSKGSGQEIEIDHYGEGEALRPPLAL